jgi:mRNA-degrading endonuclease RelE of RelBE toxin-antitoxin system
MDSMGSDDDEWSWTFSSRADDQFAQLSGSTKERIVAKLDEVVAAEWRSPGDHLEPVRNSPFQKLRVGDYRLGCRLLQDARVLRIESIRKREGAYKADD